MRVRLKAVGEQAQPAKARNEFRRFFMFNQDGLARSIAKGEVELTKTDNRVWHTLLWHADSWNYVNKMQVWLAGEAGIKQSHFSLSLKRLIECGMVVRLNEGVAHQMMLNPFYVWKGAAEDHRGGMAMFKRHMKVAAQQANDA